MVWNSHSEKEKSMSFPMSIDQVVHFITWILVGLAVFLVVITVYWRHRHSRKKLEMRDQALLEDLLKLYYSVSWDFAKKSHIRDVRKHYNQVWGLIHKLFEGSIPDEVFRLMRTMHLEHTQRGLKWDYFVALVEPDKPGIAFHVNLGGKKLAILLSIKMKRKEG